MNSMAVVLQAFVLFDAEDRDDIRVMQFGGCFGFAGKAFLLSRTTEVVRSVSKTIEKRDFINRSDWLLADDRCHPAGLAGGGDVYLVATLEGCHAAPIAGRDVDPAQIECL